MNELSQKTGLTTLFAFPFRVFFLSSALFAVLLIPIWLLVFQFGGLSLSPLPALFWHQHEMLNGFLNPAIAGFILTAICNWTGTPPLAGKALIALWLLWLAGRVSMLLGAHIPAIAVAIDLLFMPTVAAIVAVRVCAARQWRQLPLVVVLSVFSLLDLRFHMQTNPILLHALVLLGALLILVVGGRITPAFTGNWLRQNGDSKPLRNNSTLNIADLLFAALMVVCELMQLRGYTPAAIAVTAALVLLIRLQGWRGWCTAREPLLWVLHVGHLWVAVGFIFWALAALNVVSASVWVHAVGAGAIGTMILGVMTRVAMGHTGRPLKLLPGMSWGYAAVITAGVVRVISALGWIPNIVGLWLAATLWVSAFILFLYQYGPVLMAPRADGKPG
jgi:uncharacterized protein involved in response to NO